MKTTALLLALVLATGCTRHSAKIGMGVGLGVAATGGVVIVSQGDGNLGPVIVAGGLGLLGGSIFLLSLAAYGIAVANEPEAKPASRSTRPAVRSALDFGE